MLWLNFSVNTSIFWSDRQSAWWTMDGGSWHCTGDRNQDHPQEKEMQKSKWLSEKALQIAVKRREVKSKGEKERYTHLNAEFQRIARRDKKAFLSNQWKETEENNRMGKTRDTPLQCFCLENPRDGEAWWAAVYGVAQSRTRLKRISSSSSSIQNLSN